MVCPFIGTSLEQLLEIRTCYLHVKGSLLMCFCCLGLNLAYRCQVEATRRVRVETASKGLPDGPSIQYSRSLVPKTIEGVVFGTRDLNIGYLEPLGFVWFVMVVIGTVLAGLDVCH